MERTENSESNIVLIEEIKTRLASMERRLGGLSTRLRTTTTDEFLASEVLEEFTFARLYRTSKDVVYLAGLILTSEGETPPEHAHERLLNLVNKGIISSNMVSDIQLVLNFFDTIANTHQEVDQIYLWQLASHQANSLMAFGCETRRYIEQQAW